MGKFKYEDIIVCVDPGEGLELTYGNFYKVRLQMNYGKSLIIINDVGTPSKYLANRFISLKKYRNMTITKILK